MKKIIGIIFISLFTFSASLKAQEGISVEAFPMDPQTGTHNYFGVRVTLSQSYGQDVTIKGYIYDEGSPDTNHPYTLTVTAGYTTAETAANFYETGPANTATANMNFCFSASYDYAGQYHNDALDYALANLQLPISSGSDIIDIVQDYFTSISSGFSASSFLSYHTQLASDFENASNICTVFSQLGLSSQFCTYYNSINSTLDNASSPSSFNSSLLSLEATINASGISDVEKQILLATSAVYRYSASYWSSTEKTNAWNEKLNPTVAYNSYEEDMSSFDGTITKPMPAPGLVYQNYFFSWKSLAKADGKGAIEGGVAGAIVGGSVSFGTLSVPGWVVGAVGWGAGCSVSNVIGQLTGWW